MIIANPDALRATYSPLIDVTNSVAPREIEEQDGNSD